MVMLTHSDHEMKKYYDAAMLHFESNIWFFFLKKRQTGLQIYCGLCLHCGQKQSDGEGKVVSRYLRRSAVKSPINSSRYQMA